MRATSGILCGSLILLSGWSNDAQLAYASSPVITGETVTGFSSQFNGTNHAAVNAVNDNGLVGGGLHSTASGGGEQWTTATQASAADRVGEYLIVGLGDSFALTDIDIWNYGAGANRAADEVDVYISNLASPNNDFTSSDWTQVLDNVSLTAPPGGDYPADSFAITGTAQHVAVELLSFQGGNTTGELHAGLGEVQIHSSQAAQFAAEIQKTATAPTLDGLGTDAVWANATPHTTSEFLLSGNSNPSGAADLSITWKALWDDTNLYVLVEVTDDTIGPGSSGAPNFWQDDSIEIFIDAQDTNSTDYLHTSNPSPPDGATAFQFVALAGDATGDGEYPDASHVSPFASGVNSYVADDSLTQYPQESDTGVTLITDTNTYTLEVAFPWTALQETPANIQANGGFGFGVSVNDDDNDDNARDTQLTWMTSAGGLFSNASLFPTVTLVGLAGDFDDDDDVDGNDFLKWQRDLGDAASLAEWEANFGAGAGPLAAGVGAVPEPSTMALLGFAVAATAIMARRRSRFR